MHIFFEMSKQPPTIMQEKHHYTHDKCLPCQMTDYDTLQYGYKGTKT